MQLWEKAKARIKRVVMISEHKAVLAQKEHYQCNLEKVRWS